MSARDTPESERFDTTQKAEREQTDLQLIAELLGQNGIDAMESHRRIPPHLELKLKKAEVAEVQTLIHEAKTEQRYRIITPEDTTAHPSWPVDKSESNPTRTVFITRDSGSNFTPSQKNILRGSYL